MPPLSNPLFLLLLILFGCLSILYFCVFASYTRYRLLLAFCVRLVRYEFWPTPLFYLPAVIYYLILCIPHKRIDLLAFVNPGWPDPFRTPKTEILLPLVKKFSGMLPAYIHLSQNDFSSWHRRITAFQKAHSYPLVIKPEGGDRGKNVFILRDAQELKDLLQHLRPEQDYLAQEFISGTEYGIHYMRSPDRDKGHIYSLIRKEKIVLTGDGRSTLRRLILDHPRAFLMAKIHFAFHKDKLDTVPPASAEIPLVTVGAHSRGAVFCDARDLITSQLEERIDKISRALPGFYVGRYDVIATDDTALQQGKKLKILELNGVMGEPGHLYHPKTPLLKAYGILNEYCRKVVAVALLNIRAGNKPTGKRSFLATVKSALFGDS